MNETENYLLNQVKNLGAIVGDSTQSSPARSIAKMTFPSGGGGIDYDKIYIGGIEYTPDANPNGYDFLQIGADGSSTWIEEMISPMPTGYEIYNVKKNHIHITGATAGNI